jgi:hypothetical protein
MRQRQVSYAVYYNSRAHYSGEGFNAPQKGLDREHPDQQYYFGLEQEQLTIKPGPA